MEITIRPHLKERNPRMQRCEDVFQNHCTVTSSVKRGVDVQVKVDWKIDSEQKKSAAK